MHASDRDDDTGKERAESSEGPPLSEIVKGSIYANTSEQLGGGLALEKR